MHNNRARHNVGKNVSSARALGITRIILIWLMHLFRLLRTAGILGLATVSLSSCLTEPSYSNTPSISFNNLQSNRYLRGTTPVDSVLITINFQDGDGDLGITETESKNAPYSVARPGTNFRMTPFVKAAGATSFDSLKNVRPEQFLTKTSFYDRFDHISTTTDNRASPLRGVLTRRYAFLLGGYPGLKAGDEVKFTVSILDRALHQSNEIETNSIIIAPK